MPSGPRETPTRTHLPILLAMALLLALVSGDVRSARADGAPEQEAHLRDTIAATLTTRPIEIERGPPEPDPQAAGTFSGTLPTGGGTAFLTWNGGPMSQLLAAAREQGCAVQSVWALVEGRFVGYRADAPAFANAQWLGEYPGDLPGSTPVLVVCAEVRIGLLPDTLITLERFTIGRSVQGRPIEAYCAGEGSHLALLVGGMHTGTEANTVTLARRIIAEIERGQIAIPTVVQICVIPVLNPDGLAQDERLNANGVDLNRNWPAGDWQADAYHPASGPVSAGTRPLSEPETKALAQFVHNAAPAVVVAWHSYAGLVEVNGVPLAQRLGRAYAEGSGLDYIEHWDPYPITGQFIDAMEEDGVAAIDVELTWSDDRDSASHIDGLNALLAELASAVR